MVWDGAMKSACERHARQRLSALALSMEDDDRLEVPGELSSLQIWFAAVGRFAHHGRNSLKWGLARWRDKGVGTSLWVVFLSLQHSFELLQSFLPRWLQGRLRFQDYKTDIVPSFWRLLVEDDKWIDMLSRLQILFGVGYLYLALAMKGDASAPEPAISALLHLWRFRA